MRIVPVRWSCSTFILLQHAVDIDLHPRRLAGTVVGEEDVLPFAAQRGDIYSRFSPECSGGMKGLRTSVVPSVLTEMASGHA